MVAKKRNTAIPEEDEMAAQIAEVLRDKRSLFADDGEGHLAKLFKMQTTLTKKKARGKADPSKQQVTPDEKAHPFNMKMARAFQKANVHHAACLRAKVNATVGLGFYDDIVAETLDPLCGDGSWLATITRVEKDVGDTGNGYLEIVRESNAENAKITGLHYVSAPDVRVVIEDVLYNRHYLVTITGESGLPTVYAPFGERMSNERLSNARLSGGRVAMLGNVPRVAELIHFIEPTNLSRWYGMPDWISNVTSIELRQALGQHHYDFFNNRGVPEFMLFALGGKIAKSDWAAIQAAMQSHVGRGNQWKSLAMNVPNPEVKIQLEKLALEGQSDPTIFSTMGDTLALEIVSAHGVPPLLAGIALPGKMAATNELPNALMGFQALIIAQKQAMREATLANTLGDEKRNGGLPLRRKHFLGRYEAVEPPVPPPAPGAPAPIAKAAGQPSGKRKKVAGLRTILDDIDIGSMDTVARMKEPIASAQANGRDPADGLKD